jgi:hypothetical protein
VTTLKITKTRLNVNTTTNNNNCSEWFDFRSTTVESENAFEMEAYYMWERVHITEDMSRSSSYCDCTTYSCFLISVFLFTLGTIILVFSLGAFALDTVFANLGHMWIVGLLCICSAVMIGIRNVLYLRRLQQIEVTTINIKILR